MKVKVFLSMYWPYIITVTITLLTIIIIFNILDINFNPNKNTHIEKVVTIENFETHPTLDTLPQSVDYDLHKTHLTCKGLSNKSCNNASFCVLIDNEQCVGGTHEGPTYNTQNKKPISYSSYMHKGKCYGTC